MNGRFHIRVVNKLRFFEVVKKDLSMRSIFKRFVGRVCLMCEPASHASHASHTASHAIHASQGASHASHRFNVKNNQIMDIII